MKFVFALVIVALAYTHVSQSYVVHENFDSRSWIEDQAKDLLEKLYNTIKSSLSGGLDKILQAWNDAQNSEANIIENIKLKFQAVIKASEGVIGEWKEKANKAGVDVKVCYQSQEQELKNLPQKALDKAQKCLDNELAGGQKVIDDFKKFFDNTIAEFTALKLDEEIKKCANLGFWEVMPCFTNLVNKIISLTTSIPSKISTQVDNAKRYIIEMKDRLTTCGLEQVNAIQEDAKKIVDDIITCIKNKLGEKEARLLLLQ